MKNFYGLRKKDNSEKKDSEQIKEKVQTSAQSLNLDQDELNTIYHQLANRWGWSVIGVGFSLLTANPFIALGITSLAFWQHRKNQKVLKRVEDEESLKSIQRIGQILRDFWQNQSFFSEIYQIPANEELKQINYLINTSINKSFAISSITLLPNSQNFVEVDWDKKKQQLFYRKSKNQPISFGSDPLKQLIQDIEHLKKSEPELAKNPPFGILVLANPISLAHISNNYWQQLGKERYLSINGVYIVEESRLKTLMQTLIPSTSGNIDSLIRQKFPNVIKYIAFWYLFNFLFFRLDSPKISLFALYFLRTAYGKRHIHKTGRILSLGIREETEYRLSCLLREKMSRPGMNLYDNWSESNDFYVPDTPDMVLHIPPDRVFIISVKSLVSVKDQSVKVFYDPAVDTLRFRKGRRGKKNFPVDPLLESRQRVDWLLEHNPEIIPYKPIQIVVFANPIDLRHHRDTPVQFFGTRKPFLCHNEVYVVKENKLIQLVKALSPKPEKVNK